MKTTATLLTAFVLASLLSGCVSRTTSIEPQNRGASVGGKEYGSDADGEVLSKKIVWIWQKEFYNPK